MVFDNLKLEIDMLMQKMTNLPEDSHELHETLLEKLSELRALGLPVPQDLVELEKKLASDLGISKS